jgi:hypothetical protein
MEEDGEPHNPNVTPSKPIQSSAGLLTPPSTVKKPDFKQELSEKTAFLQATVTHNPSNISQDGEGPSSQLSEFSNPADIPLPDSGEQSLSSEISQTEYSTGKEAPRPITEPHASLAFMGMSGTFHQPKELSKEYFDDLKTRPQYRMDIAIGWPSPGDIAFTQHSIDQNYYQKVYKQPEPTPGILLTLAKDKNAWIHVKNKLEEATETFQNHIVTLQSIQDKLGISEFEKIQKFLWSKKKRLEKLETLFAAAGDNPNEALLKDLDLEIMDVLMAGYEFLINLAAIAIRSLSLSKKNPRPERKAPDLVVLENQLKANFEAVSRELRIHKTQIVPELNNRIRRLEESTTMKEKDLNRMELERGEIDDKIQSLEKKIHELQTKDRNWNIQVSEKNEHIKTINEELKVQREKLKHVVAREESKTRKLEISELETKQAWDKIDELQQECEQFRYVEELLHDIEDGQKSAETTPQAHSIIERKGKGEAYLRRLKREMAKVSDGLDEQIFELHKANTALATQELQLTDEFLRLKERLVVAEEEGHRLREEATSQRVMTHRANSRASELEEELSRIKLSNSTIPCNECNHSQSSKTELLLRVQQLERENAQLIEERNIEKHRVDELMSGGYLFDEQIFDDSSFARDVDVKSIQPSKSNVSDGELSILLEHLQNQNEELQTRLEQSDIEYTSNHEELQRTRGLYENLQLDYEKLITAANDIRKENRELKQIHEHSGSPPSSRARVMKDRTINLKKSSGQTELYSPITDPRDSRIELTPSGHIQQSTHQLDPKYSLPTPPEAHSFPTPAEAPLKDTDQRPHMALLNKVDQSDSKL